jgi:hypothetical protein
MGLFDLGGMDLGGALGASPAGAFSGLDPSASMGASYGGTALGGGLAGQLAGNSPVSAPGAGAGMNPLLESMLISQAAQAFGRPQQQVQAPQMGSYQNPQAILVPASSGQALGHMLLMGAA